MLHNSPLLVFFCAAVFSGAVPAASAASRTIHCEEQLSGFEASSAQAAIHEITIGEGDPAEAEISGRFGKHPLTATYMRDESNPAIYGIRLTGEVIGPMPDKAAMDQCLVEMKQKNPLFFEEGQENEYFVQTCRNDIEWESDVATQLEMTLSVDNEEVVTAFVERFPPGANSNEKIRYGIPSFLEWSCSAVK
jgi:hypothetical protein